MATSPSERAPAPRVTIASFDAYAEAQRAVDSLSDQGFPVASVSIVGTGLRYVERVAGRLTIARAALAGAGQGAMVGILFALLLGLFFTVAGTFFAVLLYGLLVGAVFGALFGALGHAATGGQRDFSSVSGVEAERYDVQVESGVADRARELLNSGAPAAGEQPAERPPPAV
jgi:anion-transporting  ArsA/GET3 family ATPase